MIIKKKKRLKILKQLENKEESLDGRSINIRVGYVPPICPDARRVNSDGGVAEGEEEEEEEVVGWGEREREGEKRHVETTRRGARWAASYVTLLNIYASAVPNLIPILVLHFIPRARNVES